MQTELLKQTFNQLDFCG